MSNSGERSVGSVDAVALIIVHLRDASSRSRGTARLIGDDEMEVGVGIYGELGRRREKLENADGIVDELLGAIVSDLPFEPGDKVALMINGLGGLPISELDILYGSRIKSSKKRASTSRRITSANIALRTT